MMWRGFSLLHAVLVAGILLATAVPSCTSFCPHPCIALFPHKGLSSNPENNMKQRKASLGDHAEQNPGIPIKSNFVESYDGMIRKHKVEWDGAHNRFHVVAEPSTWNAQRHRTVHFLKQCFLPEHVTPDYYTYTKWRILQRLVSATVSVFGTRALLLALGVKTEKVGAAATFNWIQKDAFGKFGRIMWASKMGRRFDSDAKRWRFRSSLLYATGTGLEVITYIFPAAFLFLATLANVFKQMSMLTSSATRNAMYKSFAGDSQNLGDITAKGEAQIAVVDLVGILLGISLSKLVGTAHMGMALAYICFSVVDIFAIYNEIRSVVFTSLNLERTDMVVTAFVRDGPETVPNPNQVARRERIFLNPMAISHKLFRTASQTGCSLMELEKLQEVFRDDNFMVTYHRDVGESVVLHSKANDSDVLKAILVLTYVREELARRGGRVEDPGTAYEVVKRARSEARRSEDHLKEKLRAKGWDVKHLVFGRIKHRTEW